MVISRSGPTPGRKQGVPQKYVMVGVNKRESRIRRIRTQGVEPPDCELIVSWLLKSTRCVPYPMIPYAYARLSNKFV
jgi:hypothetical protein